MEKNTPNREQYVFGAFIVGFAGVGNGRTSIGHMFQDRGHYYTVR